MAGCECEGWKKDVEDDNVYFEDGDWWRKSVGGIGFNLRIWKDNRCNWCGSKLTEEAEGAE